MSAFVLFLILCALNAVSAQQRSSNISLNSSLTPNNISSWLSPSGLYAFGFYPQKNGFSIGIVINGGSEKTLVWTAKRDENPIVSSNAVLSFSRDGTVLFLQQSPGQNILIATPEQLIASASMLDNGNFVLYDSDRIVIWQSFDSPTNTLLPGQRLKPGTNLFSSASEVDNSRGIFRLNMQTDGNLVQYPVDTPDAYYSSSTYGSGSNVSLNLDEDGRLYLLNGSLFLTNISLGGIPGRTINIMRIDVDGIFRIYSRSLDNGGNWTVRWSSTDNKCDPKGICGLNSFCTQIDQDAQCMCLPGFDLVQSGNRTAGCTRNVYWEGCKNGNNTVKFEILAAENTQWEDNPYAVLDVGIREDCMKACLDDCNCVVAHFKDRQCSKQRLPLRYGRRVLSDSNVALVKVSVATLTEDRNGMTIVRKVNRPYMLIIGIACIVVAVIVTGLSWIYVRRERAVAHKKISDSEAKSIQDVALRAFSYAVIVEATNDFKEEVGRGASGTVYKGILRDCEKVVAVKRLEKLFEDGEKEFQTEVKVIGKTYHRNLVRLIGYCINGPKRLLVFEYMNGGSLADMLFKFENMPSWEERIKIARDIARGILYLHEECETQIIHCDIKPQNILLGERGCAKISDFGLAKLLKQDQTNTNTVIRGTKGYVAPEWHRQQPVTVKADVYSFGIVLLEIICCRRSIDWSLSDDEAVLDEWVCSCYEQGDLEKLVEGHQMVDLKRLERMVKIGIWCLQDEPALRPSMKKVLLMLEGTVEIPAPPNPTSFLSSTI